MTRLWDNLQQVRSKSNDWKVKFKKKIVICVFNKPFACVLNLQKRYAVSLERVGLETFHVAITFAHFHETQINRISPYTNIFLLIQFHACYTLYTMYHTCIFPRINDDLFVPLNTMFLLFIHLYFHQRIPLM
jgi:hypothetical protein